jgi:cysteine-rich repeat protein
MTLFGAVGGALELECPPCVAECGDGVVDDATEECDDGNAVNRDACTNECRNAVCGDGIVFNRGGGTEQCDDGNNEGDDGCSAQCIIEYPCADVSGKWNTRGEAKVCCTIDGYRECEALDGARGVVNLQQNVCSLRLYEEVLGFEIAFRGEVTETEVSLYERLLPVPGLDCEDNYLFMDGTLRGDDRIDFEIEGAADCLGQDITGEEVHVRCSVSGNDVWTR